MSRYVMLTIKMSVAYLSKFLLFIDQPFTACYHLVKSIQPVLKTFDGLHVLIIQFGNRLAAFR